MPIRGPHTEAGVIVGGPRNRDNGIGISFQSKMEGTAKQRHCLSRQHSNLNIFPSFPGSRPPAARGAQRTRTAGTNQ